MDDVRLVQNASATRPLVKLNLGCGGNWRVDGWFGLDQNSTAPVWQNGREPTFLEVDLRRDLPFPDNSVDVIFSSHTLEHFTYAEAVVLLFEMYRVLRVGAPLCLVVPDVDRYIAAYIARDSEFLNTQQIVGGQPKDNPADYFLMNFYSDPCFDNSCHKYSYNMENFSSMLEMVGFSAIERVGFHDFSYWPELREDAFRSSLPHVEDFSLCVQASKGKLDGSLRNKAELIAAKKFAQAQASELASSQGLNAALVRLQNVLDESDRRGEALDAATQQVAALNKAVSRKQQELTAASAKALSLPTALAEERASFRSAATEMTALSAEPISLQIRNDILAAENEDLRSLLRGTVSERELIQRSLSWRLTRPLRAIVGLSPRLYRRLRSVARLCYVVTGVPLRRAKLPRVGGSPAGLTVERRGPALDAVSRSSDVAATAVGTGAGGLSPLERRFAEATRIPPNAARPEPTRYSPLISIILPVYDTPLRYLKEALQSVVDQSYEKWDLCIVDDGSTAAHVAPVLREAAADPRIRVEFVPANGGIASASQRALEMAQGEFVAFLDHDDMLAPAALAAIVDVLRGDPALDMIYSDHAIFDETGAFIEEGLKPGWSPELFLSTNYVAHLNVIRTSLVRKVDGFTGTLDLSRDTGLILKVIDAGARIAHCPQMLYFWRAHRNSVAIDAAAKPRIGYTGYATIDAYLKRHDLPANAAWPLVFRRARLGAYKLEFPATPVMRICVVVPMLHEDAELRHLPDLLRSTGIEPLPQIHLIGVGITPSPGLLDNVLIHTADDQAAFDAIVAELDCEAVVFLAPNGQLISPDWLRELVGYLPISPGIGAVGGKILDATLSIADGSVLLTPSLPVLGGGQSDAANGYWQTWRIASNVEAVSSHLMATRRSVYLEVGGLPVFDFGDAAGIAYCLRLRRAGYRVVMNPWSKIVEDRQQSRPTDLATRLVREFGTDCLKDRYYHPFFSAEAPYELT